MSGPSNRATHDDAKALARELLANGGRPTREILREIAARGVSRRTWVKVRKDLGIESRPDGFQGRWILTLPLPEPPTRGGLSGLGPEHFRDEDEYRVLKDRERFRRPIRSRQ